MNHAAGILFVTPDKHALFLKRTGKGDHNGTWCTPGGGMEGDERPIDAAIRETREETGWIRPEDLGGKPEQVDKQDNGYVMFRQKIGSPFIPTLDEEHSAWAWAPLDEPPQPVHPALAKTLLAHDAWSTVDPEKSVREGQADSHLRKA